jgi:hypothetical protein
MAVARGGRIIKRKNGFDIGNGGRVMLHSYDIVA